MPVSDAIESSSTTSRRDRASPRMEAVPSLSPDNSSSSARCASKPKRISVSQLPRADPSSRDELCDSEFCQVLQSFQVPAEFDNLIEAFIDHVENKRRECGSDRLVLGPYEQIVRRVRCPFCRLVVASVREGGSWCSRIVTAVSQIRILVKGPGHIELDVEHYELPFRLGERITFCDPRGQLGRSTARIITELRVNINHIQHWLRKCEAVHTDTCQAKSLTTSCPGRTLPTIRLIDVAKRCIVQRTWATRYLALSYVWGNKAVPRLLKANVQELSIPGALLRRMRLPRTIDDAIYLTASLGETYLWIDCMCLLQDDRSDLAKGIAAMDLIYESAYATIVAANGPDVDSGLPRLQRDGLPGAQHAELIKPGLELMHFNALDHRLDRACYSSRGWTLQEQIHSRRMIILVDDRVYMRCREEVFSEDRGADAIPNVEDYWAHLFTILEENFNRGQLPDLENMLFFFQVVSRLQARNLTHPHDAINAIAGVLDNVAEKMQTGLIEGIPIRAVDLALLFDHFSHPSWRWSKDNTRGLSFPSWSWAGWNGSVQWLYEPRQENATIFLNKYCWVIWFVCDSSGLKVLHNFKDILKTRRRQSATLFPALDTDHWRPQPRSTISHYTLLIFWTVTITLRAVASRDQDSGRRAELFDVNSRRCGFIQMDLAVRDRMDHLVTLVLLSAIAAAEKKTCWSRIGEEHDYWVLLLTWKGSFYERRGRGYIMKEALNHSYEPGPQWNEIVLG